MYLFRSKAGDDDEDGVLALADMAGAGAGVENSAGNDNEKSSGGNGGVESIC